MSYSCPCKHPGLFESLLHLLQQCNNKHHCKKSSPLCRRSGMILWWLVWWKVLLTLCQWFLKHIWAASWRNQKKKTNASSEDSAQSDQSSLCTLWVAKDPICLHADSEDSDQTRRTPSLIWVFVGRTCHFGGFVVLRLMYNELISQLNHLIETSLH